MNQNIRQMLAEAALQLGAVLSVHQQEQLITFMEHLLDSNTRHNLTAITSPKDIIVKHFSDSLTLLPHIDKPGRTLVDVGTGAGFPGVVLAIARPKQQFCLMDSQAKRIAFISEVCMRLGLANVSAVKIRAEDAGRSPKYRDCFDFATARAVAPLAALAEYSLPLVKPGGCFFAMKGPSPDEEIKAALPTIDALGAELIGVGKTTLPFSDINHSILLIEKLIPTPAGFPRSQTRIKRNLR